MRISSSMLFDRGVQSINNQTAKLLHTQQQLSANTRILTPSDDPVAAARALDVTQSQNVNTQFATNIKNAQSALGLEDSTLSSTTDLLSQVQSLAVYAGNATLTAADRKSVATQLRAAFDQLMGTANAADSSGNYLFSGYMGNTKPFAGSLDAMVKNPALDVTYQGDSGQQSLQVSASRLIPVSDAGNDVFMNIRSGNGSFATAASTTNSGSGVIDSGSVTNPAAWAAAPTQNVSVKFWVDPTSNQTYYDLVDPATSKSMFSNTASTQGGAGNTFTHAYAPGAAIPLSGLDAAYGTDMGASITITGKPASNDTFSVVPSTSKSVFRTIADLVGTLENTTPGGVYSSQLGTSITELGSASNNLLRVRTAVGTRMSELDSLSTVNSSLDLQYQQNLSTLQDLDVTKAISDLTQQKNNLDAAQLTFSKVTGLSLFNYLK